jgi:hypothetical protein
MIHAESLESIKVSPSGLNVNRINIQLLRWINDAKEAGVLQQPGKNWRNKSLSARLGHKLPT